MKIKAVRMVEFEFDCEEEGICFNRSMGAGRLVTVKAGEAMCSVGMIRRGREWEDYGGRYCAECPYFISKRLMGEREKELLEELKKALGGFEW